MIVRADASVPDRSVWADLSQHAFLARTKALLVKPAKRLGTCGHATCSLSMQLLKCVSYEACAAVIPVDRALTVFDQCEIAGPSLGWFVAGTGSAASPGSLAYTSASWTQR